MSPHALNANAVLERALLSHRPNPSIAATVIRILLVDEPGVLREGIRLLLSRTRGLEVVEEVGDTDAALAALHRLRPNLVLLDPGLPDLDGKDLIPRLLEADPRVRILVLSAFASGAEVTRALTQGARGYLLKRESSATLIKAIRRVGQGDRHLSPEAAVWLLERTFVKPLTARELEIMDRVAHGCSTEDLAQQMKISLHTLKTHFTHILEKLDAKDRTQALVEAVRRGLVRIPNGRPCCLGGEE